MVTVTRTLWVLFKVTVKAVTFLAKLGHKMVTATTLCRCRRQSAEHYRRHLTSFSQPPEDRCLHHDNSVGTECTPRNHQWSQFPSEETEARACPGFLSSYITELRRLCLVVTEVELESRLFTVLGPHVTLISLL